MPNKYMTIYTIVHHFIVTCESDDKHTISTVIDQMITKAKQYMESPRDRKDKFLKEFVTDLEELLRLWTNANQIAPGSSVLSFPSCSNEKGCFMMSSEDQEVYANVVIKCLPICVSPTQSPYKLCVVKIWPVGDLGSILSTPLDVSRDDDVIWNIVSLTVLTHVIKGDEELPRSVQKIVDNIEIQEWLRQDWDKKNPIVVIDGSRTAVSYSDKLRRFVTPVSCFGGYITPMSELMSQLNHDPSTSKR